MSGVQLLNELFQPDTIQQSKEIIIFEIIARFTFSKELWNQMDGIDNCNAMRQTANK
jgi:hypothetical protein